MPSNLDILAANDFERNPLLEPIVRRKRGDRKKFEKVMAVVEIDSVTAQSANYQEGGQSDEGAQNQKVAGGRIEVAASQATHSDDEWEIHGALWKAIGDPQGADAGSKTIVIIKKARLRGRKPDVNT